MHRLFRASRLILAPMFFSLTACFGPRPQPLPPELSGDYALDREQAADTYTACVIAVGDYDSDGSISRKEWTGTGGSLAAFEKLDQNGNGLLVAEEIRRIARQEAFYQSVTGMMDRNRDGVLTARELKAPPGYRLMRVDF